jgi:hypothetical protein
MEMPSITASTYASSAVDHKAPFGGGQVLMDRRMGGQPFDLQEMFKNAAQVNANPLANQQKKEQTMSTARIVKVFIADPNENLPLEKRVLYSGDEKLTDLTDQELFFDVPIADLLSKHNDARKATVDKTQAEKFGRDIFLEPARIRDLKMVVVTVAQF